jgi:AcrR family transcriptional regulator
MSGEERPLRADAERNRRRVVDAAAAMFCERGLDVAVGEIAARAGVGRGTLFRNFPSKEHLIAAIVVERMQEAVARGQALLDADDPGAALFEFVEEIVGRQQVDRALFEAIADVFLANQEIRCAYSDVLDTLSALLQRAQDAGAVRPDVGAVDVMMLVKGACQAASSFQHLDPEIGDRQLDLMRGALSLAAGERPLRGRPARIEDLERGPQTPPDLSRSPS